MGVASVASVAASPRRVPAPGRSISWRGDGGECLWMQPRQRERHSGSGRGPNQRRLLEGFFVPAACGIWAMFAELQWSPSLSAASRGQ